MSMTDVFENMTAREAAKIVVKDGVEVDVDDLASCVRRVAKRCSKRVATMTRTRGARATLREKGIERTILEAAKAAVAEAVGLKQRPELEAPPPRLNGLVAR